MYWSSSTTAPKRRTKKMSNSKLVSYTRLSPNCSKPRNHSIDKITIHHMVFDHCTVEPLGVVGFYFLDGTRIGIATQE